MKRKKFKVLLLVGLMTIAVTGCSDSNMNDEDDMSWEEDDMSWEEDDESMDEEGEELTDEDENEGDGEEEEWFAEDWDLSFAYNDFSDFISGCRIVIADAMSELNDYYDAEFYATEAASYLNSMSSYALDLACERIFAGDPEDAMEDIESYLYITPSEYDIDSANGTAVVKGTDSDGEEVVITVEYEAGFTAQCSVRDGAGNLTWYVSYTKCDDYVAYSYAVESITTISIKFNNGDNLYVFDRTNPLEEYYTVYENDTITTSDITENHLYYGLVDGVFINKSE